MMNRDHAWAWSAAALLALNAAILLAAPDNPFVRSNRGGGKTITATGTGTTTTGTTTTTGAGRGKGGQGSGLLITVAITAIDATADPTPQN